MKAVPPTGKISDVFGFLKGKNSPFLSIEVIKEIAARGRQAMKTSAEHPASSNIASGGPHVLARRHVLSPPALNKTWMAGALLPLLIVP